MILRSSFVRHGRQVVSLPTRRSLATDFRQPFGLPTNYAEPPPSKSPFDTSSATETDSHGQEQDQDKPLWVQPKISPLARWNKRRKVVLDKKPAQAWRVKQALEKANRNIGGVVEDRFNPSSLLRDPPRPEDVTLELLMASQCHMGHHKSLWNPAMQRYIYGIRSDIHVISLEETAAALRRAAKIVEQVAYFGGLMLFVGNRKGQMEVIARAAQLAGACHLFTKWVPGTITNRDVLLAKEELKIVDHQDKPVTGFERHLLERRPIMPDLVVVLNPLENFTLLHECALENIPTIGLVDTNGDPTKVTYTIPGNDDSLRAVSVVAGVLGRAGEAGQTRRKKDAKRGLCTWRNPPEIERWIESERARKAEDRDAAKEADNYWERDDLSRGRDDGRKLSEATMDDAKMPDFTRALRAGKPASHDGDPSDAALDKLDLNALDKMGDDDLFDHVIDINHDKPLNDKHRAILAAWERRKIAMGNEAES